LPLCLQKTAFAALQQKLAFCRWPEYIFGMNDLIVSDPEILGGTPVFKGTSVPVENVLACVREGLSAEEILRHYPSLSREQALAALRFQAAQRLSDMGGRAPDMEEIPRRTLEMESIAKRKLAFQNENRRQMANGVLAGEEISFIPRDVARKAKFRFKV
jgi:uncharacterized protein (DUF433 family)